jgi:putative heme transporter
VPMSDIDRAVTAPHWLRELGISAWLLVGVGLLLAGVFWVLGEAATIVGPMVLALVVATVASPAVGRLHRHGLGRGWGALLVLLALVALAVVILFLVLHGVVGQGDEIKKLANQAADKARHWLESAGATTTDATTVENSVKSATPQVLKGLAAGLVSGVRDVVAIALGLSFSVFGIFFLLKDGPKLRRVVDRHLRLPLPVAHAVTGEVVGSVRRYFLGVTLVASFNALVVGVAALVLGVPLVGTIAVVTFVTAYVPFIGAFVAGAFAVILALGAKGTAVALIMLVVVLLANGLLQNIFQPIAMGASLDMNPLLTLVVTIGFGAIFGMIGLVLAAPLVAAALHLPRAIAAARAGETEAPREPEVPAAAPVAGV